MDENKKEENQNSNSDKEPKTRNRRTRKTTTTASSEKESAQNKTSVKKENEKSSEPKEPTNFEESVEYLKTIGLKKVSNKTFINEADLEAFLNGDFTNINKTRAFGFIQILEREYPVKLDELKKAYLSYHQQNHSKEQPELFPHPKDDTEREWKRYFIWLAPLVLLGGIGLYFVGEEKSELSTLESEEKVVSTDINTDIVLEAEKNLTQYENKNKIAFTSKEHEEVINSDRVSPLKRETTTASVNTTATAALSKKEKSPKSDDLDLDLMVKQMVKEYNLTSVEENNETQKEKNDTQVKEEVIIAKAASKDVVEKKKVVEKPVEKKTKKEVKKKTSANKSKKETIHSKLYIVPHKKSWVGIIYLDDYTKRDFLIRKTLKLNPKRPQLIVVGQKEFEIFNNGYSYRFRGKGPVRFIYKDGDIMEITNREFKAYSKGVSW